MDDSLDGSNAGTAAADCWGRCLTAWRTVKAAASGALVTLDSGLRSALRANLHALVSLSLILVRHGGTRLPDGGCGGLQLRPRNCMCSGPHL